jgi:hypothetical protein
MNLTLPRIPPPISPLPRSWPSSLPRLLCYLGLRKSVQSPVDPVSLGLLSELLLRIRLPPNRKSKIKHAHHSITRSLRSLATPCYGLGHPCDTFCDTLKVQKTQCLWALVRVVHLKYPLGIPHALNHRRVIQADGLGSVTLIRTQSR